MTPKPFKTPKGIRAHVDPIDATVRAALELTDSESRTRHVSLSGVTTSELACRWPPTERAATRRLERGVFAAMLDAEISPRTG